MKNQEELQYLNLVKDILENGIKKQNRTGISTICKFGCSLRFNLKENKIPLLTTKKMYWKAIVEELFFFIKSQTDSKILSSKNIHIWKKYSSREYLDSIGLKEYPEGQLGPVYGFQWRHFGAKYIDSKEDYKNQGIDQLKDCINKIKNEPNSRRIIVSAWNPIDIPKMALPPCHVLFQFFVDEDTNELSCCLYQRSADVGLGLPFNIASYSLLTHLIAYVTERKPKEFIHFIGDTHIYELHVEKLKEQTKREPYEFPKVEITGPKDIDMLEPENIKLIGYKSHEKIELELF